MRRVLKGLAWLVACALLILAAMFTWGRLRPPTDSQARALDALKQDLKPAQGRNAFPLLWFVDFDVPADQLDAAYAKELQRAHAWAANKPGPDAGPMPGPQSTFPALPKLTADEKATLCVTREKDCLGKVRAHREEIRALLSTHATRLARDEALSGYDYAWSDVPVGMEMVIPPYGASMGLWMSATAFEFVDGRTSQAMQQACSQVLTMRKLHARNNTLIGEMIFAVRLQGAVNVFLQMLAELPADEALPASCGQAFAPLTAMDVDMCASAQTEFVFAQSVIANVRESDEPWYRRWSWSSQGTRRLSAQNYGAQCAPMINSQLLADRPIALASVVSGPDVFDMISNAAGSVLTRMALPAYGDYVARQQDAVASLRLGASVLWLRQAQGQPGSLSDHLAQRPAWMHVATDRQLQLSADGRSISMRLHNQPNEWPTTWPLPAEL